MWLLRTKKAKGLASKQSRHTPLSENDRVSFKRAWRLCLGAWPLAFLAPSNHMLGALININAYFLYRHKWYRKQPHTRASIDINTYSLWNTWFRLYRPKRQTEKLPTYAILYVHQCIMVSVFIHARTYVNHKALIKQCTQISDYLLNLQYPEL